jgi:hypothetical protein
MGFPKPGKTQKAGHAGNHRERPDQVMPAREGVQSAIRRYDHQGRGAKYIAGEHPKAPEEDQGNTPYGREPKQFAQDKRNHDARLESSDAATRIVHADKSISELDDIANLISPHSDPAGNFHRAKGHNPHQVLDDEILNPDGPRNRYERKANRKDEVPDPCHASGTREGKQRVQCDQEREVPTKQTPVGISLFDDTKRKQRQQNEAGQEGGDRTCD